MNPRKNDRRWGFLERTTVSLKRWSALGGDCHRRETRPCNGDGLQPLPTHFSNCYHLRPCRNVRHLAEVPFSFKTAGPPAGEAKCEPACAGGRSLDGVLSGPI